MITQKSETGPMIFAALLMLMALHRYHTSVLERVEQAKLVVQPRVVDIQPNEWPVLDTESVSVTSVSKIPHREIFP